MISNLSQTMQSANDVIGNFTNKAATSVTTEAKSALNQVKRLVGDSGQTPSDLSSDLSQSVYGLDEATAELRTSVLETTGGAISTITEATNRVVNAVKETTEQATGTLNDATSVAVHKLNDATSSITQTAEKTKFALDETLQKVEQLNSAISNSVQDLVATSVTRWMAEHPMVSWVIAHPLWTIVLVLLTLFLGWSLLRAVAQFTQQALLFILQAPLKSIQSLSKSMFHFFGRADIPHLTKSNNQRDVQKRLPEILNRLEILRQEQEALMKEMHSILLSKS